MNFCELKSIIKDFSVNKNFQDASEKIQNIIFSLNKTDFIPLITEIGSIPEDIAHDSTEDELYTKVSDIILAKCFMELGLKAQVIRERANCADVMAQSIYHDYSLVADAKSFRLSRTAKNQKDFKVESMVHWRCDNDYSVLCCPYFQYPKNSSQIYGSAINGNVSLFSWEYFSILLQENIAETPEINLADLWNFSKTLSASTTVEQMNIRFLEKQNDCIKLLLKLTETDFDKYLSSFKKNIVERGEAEIQYWEQEISNIKEYSREQAIEMLIKSLRLNEKINAINNHINQLKVQSLY